MGPGHSFGDAQRHGLGAKRQPSPWEESLSSLPKTTSKKKSQRKATSCSPLASLADKASGIEEAAGFAPVTAPASSYTPRVGYLILTMYVGKSYNPRFPQSVLWAAISVAAAIVGQLYMNNMLHRNISSGNILIARGKSFIKLKNPWGWADRLRFRPRN
jgi:hypothetical protein